MALHRRQPKKAGRPRDSDGRLSARKAESLRRSKPPPPPALVRRRFHLSVKKVEDYCRTLIPGYDPWRDANGYKFDPKLARAECKWFHDELTHVKGEMAGEPFTLEPWEVALIGNIFGWLDKGGARRYREVLLYIPRKNGKTPLAAGLVNRTLFKDREPGAEIYGAADKHERARYVFDHAAGMVQRNPKLLERAQIFRGQAKAIQLRRHEDNVDDLSVYRLISGEKDVGHGQNIHVVVVDELHLQPNRELVDSLSTATASKGRRQPLIVYLTTADHLRPSICNEIYEYACRVRDGLYAPQFLPMIYEAGLTEDWTDEKVWERVNPNLDVSVSRDYLRSECQKAKDAPANENRFKRLHLNIRTEQDVRFIDMGRWDACGEVVDPEALKGKSCWGGLDLATTRDCTALALLFPDGAGEFDLLMRFWLPAVTAEKRSPRVRALYEEWVRAGLITTTPGDVCDYAAVRRDINALGNRYGIQDIGVDRTFQGMQLCTELMGDGFQVEAFGQGYGSMCAPTVRFEELVREGKLRHGANPVLRWMASNMSVDVHTSGDIKPSRDRSSEKIDGIVAAIMAVGRWMVHVDRPVPTVTVLR